MKGIARLNRIVHSTITPGTRLTRQHTTNKSPRVCLVVGAGNATGGAIARRFAREGFVSVCVRRNGDQLKPLLESIRKDGGVCHGFGLDARKEENVVPFIEKIEREIGPIEIAVFNIGANIRFPILEQTAQKYYKVWEMAAFSGFLVGREVARYMVPRKSGSIMFTGATASVRGGAGFAAFSGAKSTIRSLSQSMARELGPKGVHVTHIIVDGMIDTEWSRSNFQKQIQEQGPDGILDPDAIAENYWFLHNQPRNAWTWEMDLRPWVEKW